MYITERLSALRKLMRENGMDAYVIVTDDFHGSEYVGDYFKEREFMSGFTGSAGKLVVLSDWAGLWTDGRYFLQAADQLKGSTIELMKENQPGVPKIPDFLGDKVKEGGVIGFDGRTISSNFADAIESKVSAKNISFDGTKDLVDEVWKDRPAISKKPVWEISTEMAGMSRADKLAALRSKMAEKNADVMVLTALDEIAWLLNLRGDAVSCPPVFLAYMIVKSDEAVLFVHREILDAGITEGLSGDGITLDDYENIYSAIEAMETGTVMVDPDYANYMIFKSMRETVTQIKCMSPVRMLKAVKNPVEMENERVAHVKDGAALTHFIYWLQHNIGKEKITELSAAEKLEQFRAAMEGYMGPSFDPILGYGPHGAIIHYEPTPESDVEMKPASFCLADTGGHYREGTTDVTRTIPLGTLTDEEKRAYTLVLKGHLNLGAARFMKGACGANLDYAARKPLWENGLDYNHGTGHGVGYILSVHEGPQRLTWHINSETEIPFEEGMILSDEPGLYLEGKFGIRHENLVVVKNGEKNEFGQFMHFEELTMVPFDKSAIDVSLMSEEDIKQLNRYHEKVYKAISPYFEGEELEWLKECTKAL